MRKLIFFISIFAAAILFVSCVPKVNGDNGDTGSTEDIIIKAFIEYTQTNVEFLAYKDGKTGEWKKLTGTSGLYKFTPTSVDGNFSVFAVNKGIDSWSSDTLYDIKIINMNKSEGKLVPLYFDDMTYTYDATLNLNFDSDFLNKTGAIFFGHNHGFPWFDTVDDLTYPLEYYESTHDLVVLAAPNQSSDVDKIYIDRDFNLSGEENKSISYDDLISFETFVATSTISDTYTWGDVIVGGNTYTFTWLDGDRYIRIPSTIDSPDDLYEIGVGKSVNGFYLSNVKFITDPADIETMNVLPSSSWASPTISSNTLTWSSYSSSISGQTLRVYIANLMNDDWTIKWEVTNSAEWLGSSSSYNYQMPELSSLTGWVSDWLPTGVSEFSEFSAVSTNNNDLIYILNPQAGFQFSTISY